MRNYGSGSGLIFATFEWRKDRNSVFKNCDKKLWPKFIKYFFQSIKNEQNVGIHHEKLNPDPFIKLGWIHCPGWKYCNIGKRWWDRVIGWRRELGWSKAIKDGPLFSKVADGACVSWSGWTGSVGEGAEPRGLRWAGPLPPDPIAYT